MDELGEWLRESVDDYGQMSPIQKLEFREEINRLSAEGLIVVIHTRKGMTYYIDRMKEAIDE